MYKLPASVDVSKDMRKTNTEEQGTSMMQFYEIEDEMEQLKRKQERPLKFAH